MRVASTPSQCDRLRTDVSASSSCWDRKPVAGAGHVARCWALVKESWPPTSSPEAGPGGQRHGLLGQRLLPATAAELSLPRSLVFRPLVSIRPRIRCHCPFPDSSALPLSACPLPLSRVAVIRRLPVKPPLSFPVGVAEGAGVNEAAPLPVVTGGFVAKSSQNKLPNGI